MIITNEWLEASCKTIANGWTRGVQRLLGVPFPLRTGWKDRLIGNEITSAQYLKIFEFLEKRNAKLKRRKKKCNREYPPDKYQGQYGIVFAITDGSRSDWALNTDKGRAWWSQKPDLSKLPWE